MSDSQRAIQRVRDEAGGLLQRARARYDGLAEDSYASRLEAGEDVRFFAEVSRKVNAATPGATVDLRKSVPDDGYDPEEAADAQFVGLAYVSPTEKAVRDYDRRLSAIGPLLRQLQDAGVTVETGVQIRYADPPQHERVPVADMLPSPPRNPEPAKEQLDRALSALDMAHRGLASAGDYSETELRQLAGQATRSVESVLSHPEAAAHLRAAGMPEEIAPRGTGSGQRPSGRVGNGDWRNGTCRHPCGRCPATRNTPRHQQEGCS